MRPPRGQGLPSSATQWPLAFALALLGILPACSYGQESDPLEYRFRLHWESAEPTAWRGRLTAEKGELTGLQVLGTEFDAPGAAHEQGGELFLHQRRPVSSGDIDFTVRAAPDTKLRVLLQRSADPRPRTFEIPIGQAARTPYQQPLDEPGGSFEVRRLPSDRLRIRSQRQSLIFEPGEQFTFNVVAALEELSAGSPVDLSIDLLPNRGGKPLWSNEAQRLSGPVGGFASIETKVPLPENEGVYTIRLSALRPPGSVKAWLPGSSGKTIAERSFQVVVFDSRLRPQYPASWQVSQEIDPTHKRWWDRLPKWVWLRRAPWLPVGPLGNSPAEIVHTDSQRWVRLAPADGERPTWQAYPMPVSRTGEPHLVEIEFPTDTPQQLVLTVMDHNAQGEGNPLGASCGAIVSDWEAHPTSNRTIRRIFWPKSRSPLLVLSNADPDTPARFGRIRVLSVDGQAPAPTPQSSESRVMAQVTTADLPAALGATYRASPEQEDWSTFYEVSERLADLINLNEQDGAVVTVASSAGTLYPSDLLGGHPGADRQRLASGANDLPRKDALELLLKEFDRRDLTLIPSVRFESLIPRLEEARRSRGAGAVAARGQRETNRADYSLLSEEVQLAIAAAVEELHVRYGRHSSFGGVALEITANSFALFRNDTSGIDQRSMNAFLIDSELEWPTGVPQTLSAFENAVSGPWKSPWRQWRADRVTNLITNLAQQAGQCNAKRRLLILADGALSSAIAAPDLRPQLDVEPDSPAVMLAMGFDLQALGQIPGVELVQPRFLPGADRLAAEALRIQSNAGFTSPTSRSTALINPASQQRLRSLEQVGPFGDHPISAQLSVVPSSESAREEMASILGNGTARTVLEGGRALSLTIDERLLEARRMIRLSSSRTTTARTAVQEPLIVRVADHAPGDRAGRSIVTFANPSPWRIDARVTLRIKAECRVEVLGHEEPLANQVFGPGEHVLEPSLAPYEVQMFLFDGGEVEPLGVSSRVEGAAAEDLSSRLRDLRNRNLNAQRLFTKQPNPSFEQVDSEKGVIGWQAYPTRDGGAASITSEDIEHGSQALRLSSRGEPVVVRSVRFPSPDTGQVAVIFRVRAKQVETGSLLRLALEQQPEGYRSSTEMNAQQLSTGQDSWRPFVFSVDDIPVDDRGKLRVRFELEGGGQVDIDQIEMHELVFPLDFLAGESARQKLSLLKTIHAAETAFEAGRVSDCRRQLQGYWPRFLLNYTPKVEATPTAPEKVASAPKPPKPAENAPAENEDSPGLGDRIKDYIPKFMRF